jgi:hypothetical protein
MGSNNVTLRGRLIRPFSLAHACCYARLPLCYVPSMHCRPVAGFQKCTPHCWHLRDVCAFLHNHKAAISLTSWVCAHERFANARNQLGQPLFCWAPRYARELSNLHAIQSKKISLIQHRAPNLAVRARIYKWGRTEGKSEMCMTQIAIALAPQTPLANVVLSLINHDCPHIFPTSNFLLVAVTGPSRGWPSGALRWICASPRSVVHVTGAARALLVI